MHKHVIVTLYQDKLGKNSITQHTLGGEEFFRMGPKTDPACVKTLDPTRK